MIKTKRQCFFKQNGIKHIDYKNTDLLEKSLSPHGRILPSVRTGVSRKYQEDLTNAVKRARFMGLLPFVNS